MAQELNISWGNYLKPTPKNVERILKSIRRFYLTITGGSILMDAPEWVPVTVLIIGALLEEASSFVGSIAHEEEEQIVMKYPKELSDQISVSVETVPNITKDVEDREVH